MQYSASRSIMFGASAEENGDCLSRLPANLAAKGIKVEVLKEKCLKFLSGKRVLTDG